MSSRSINSANVSGRHLKHTFWGTAVRATVTKIFPPTLKQRSSPHCRFSVASGKAMQYSRISSTFIVVSTISKTCSANRSTLIYFPARQGGSYADGHSGHSPATSGLRHADGDSLLPRRAGVQRSLHLSARGRLQLRVAQAEWRGSHAQYRLRGRPAPARSRSRAPRRPPGHLPVFRLPGSRRCLPAPAHTWRQFERTESRALRYEAIVVHRSRRIRPLLSVARHAADPQSMGGR